MIIGIDLGTSTTEAAVYRGGKTEMIPNFDEKIVTPSAIGLDESGNFVIGEKAKAHRPIRQWNCPRCFYRM